MNTSTTSKLVNEDNGYKTYLDSATGLFTRVHEESGRTFVWVARKKRTKPVFKARNGVTIELLEKAGHKIRVKHFRWAVYLGLNERPIKGRFSSTHDYEMRAICVPSTYRKDPMYRLLPKGGYSHISIKTPEGKYICVSSECSESDPFCYLLGTAKALERLTAADLALLKVAV